MTVFVFHSGWNVEKQEKQVLFLQVLQVFYWEMMIFASSNKVLFEALQNKEGEKTSLVYSS